MLKHLLFAAALLLALGAQAQAPADGGPAPVAPAATEIPLDGGASLLLAGGIGYAVRRLRLRRRK